MANKRRPPKRQRYHLVLLQATYDEIKDLAVKKDMSVAAAIRVALRQYIEREGGR